MLLQQKDEWMNVKALFVKRLSIGTVALLTAVLPAAAVSFDFDHLGRGAALDFLPTDGINVTGGDLASSNVHLGNFDGDLNYTVGDLTATVTGTYFGEEAAVVQDSTSNWTDTRGAGLGVYHAPVDRSDDNITDGELLTITFNRVVTITSIGLRAEGHNFTGWTPGATFLLDGGNTALPIGIGSINVEKTGTAFTFSYGGDTPDQFYVASLEVQEVPEAGATAVLLGLSVLGLGGFRKRLVRK